MLYINKNLAKAIEPQPPKNVTFRIASLETVYVVRISGILVRSVRRKKKKPLK